MSSKMNVFGFVITPYIACAIFNVVGAHEPAENSFSEIIKKSLVATAHSCMDHVNATVKDLEKLREEPPYPEESACIVQCLFEKIGVVRGNKYSKIGFMTAVTPLVFTNRKKLEHMKVVSENCDREVNHKHDTPCQVGNEVTTCIFKYAPELHFNKSYKSKHENL